MTPQEIAVLKDLTHHATSQAIDAVMRVAALATPAGRPAILLRCAFVFAEAAATLYADQELVSENSPLDNPATLKAFQAIVRSWAMAPDAGAMDASLAADLNAVPIEFSEGAVS